MKLISQQLQVRLSGGWMEMDDARVSRVSWNLVKATEKGKSIAKAFIEDSEDGRR